MPENKGKLRENTRNFQFGEMNKMADFSVNEMQKVQKELQEKYKDKWEPIGAETGKSKLLWNNNRRIETGIY